MHAKPMYTAYMLMQEEISGGCRKILPRQDEKDKNISKKLGPSNKNPSWSAPPLEYLYIALLVEDRE